MENGSFKRFRDISWSDINSESQKRKRFNELSGYDATTTAWRFQSEQSRNYSFSPRSAPSSSNGYSLNVDKWGGSSKDIQALVARRNQLIDQLSAENAQNPYLISAIENGVESLHARTVNDVIIDLTDEQDESTVAINPVIILDSDDDENNEVSENCSNTSAGVNSENTSSSRNLIKEDLVATDAAIDNCVPPVVKQPGNLLHKDFVVGENNRPPHLKVKLAKPSEDLSLKEVEESCPSQRKSPAEVDTSTAAGNDSAEDKGVYVGTGDESGEVSDTNSDGLHDIWSEMNVALESFKDPFEDASFDEDGAVSDNDCEHSFILKDDVGDVCRICGIIKRGIEKIIEYNFSKANRSTRTYPNEGRVSNRDLPDAFFLKRPSDDLYAGEIIPHPRHGEVMKPHQVEGFKFLESNLVTGNPGGCIMAHAPGSGKTFMIISFLQSFMAKYPKARPLIVLPKGLIGIWRKEFRVWQVENIPLYDFYSAKADHSRSQQLDVIKEWVKHRSILLLGYCQFTTIIRNEKGDEETAACQNSLLKVPSILIMDEGHTPRNNETDTVNFLKKVETPRKVVLSGTLYQNHVEEVFNILDLVCPRFLKMETSKAMKRRIMSKVEITGKKGGFYQLIEDTLTENKNHERKMAVIQDLREMTRRVLHYFKGDSLRELPGLVDFSVFLHLSKKQEKEVKLLNASSNNRFVLSSKASRIYLHPALKDLVSDGQIDQLLQNFNVREGVKVNFYLNLLKLCVSSGEKLLVFSQYVRPLNFLVRMTAKLMGYALEQEMFMITGDSDCGQRDASMEKFNNSPDARVLFGSIKACGEGISLVGASRVLMLDVHCNPSVTRQALGRAFRPGQVRKVYTYRLVASGTPEEHDHATCYKKESISKLWFEWDQSSGPQSFDMEKVNVNDCGDTFLGTGRLNEDVVALLKR